MTHSIQVRGDVAVGVEGGFFAAELDDFACYADGLVGEGVEVGGVDAGGGEGFSHCWGYIVLFWALREVGGLRGVDEKLLVRFLVVKWDGREVGKSGAERRV